MATKHRYIRRLENGKWQVNIDLTSKGIKQSKKEFRTLAEANQHVTWFLSNVAQDPDWTPKKRDMRRLSELVTAWYEQHGIGLSNGAKTLQNLNKACIELGDPVAANFTIDDFAMYRKNRIERGITPNTINRIHAYLRAVFNHLIKADQWQKDNPLNKLKQFKIQEKADKKFLSLDQIEALLIELKNCRNPHAYLISKVCLSTGGRWGEVVGLRTSQVKNQTLQFAETKSKKTRAVKIDAELQGEILAHAKLQALPDDRIFENAEDAFFNAIKAANIKLDKFQKTHILRHTFASHFVMQGRNLLTLQKILGHVDYKTTLGYAHLAPDHLQETVEFNPLALLKRQS